MLRWPRVAWLHLPAVAWGAVVEFCGWPCPLTGLELRLRRAAGQPAAGDFVERWLLPILYPDELTRSLQVTLGIGLLALNAALYAVVLARRRR